MLSIWEKGWCAFIKLAPLIMSGIRNTLTHKNLATWWPNTAQTPVHMRVLANHEDQCRHKQAKKRDLPMSPYHRGERVREAMRDWWKKLSCRHFKLCNKILFSIFHLFRHRVQRVKVIWCKVDLRNVEWIDFIFRKKTD